MLRKIHKKGHLDLQNRPQAEAFREFRESLGMRLALRVAAQLKQATRMAVSRVDAEVDEFGNKTSLSALSVKRLTGCVPGSPPPAKRRVGETPATPPPVGGTGNRAQQSKPGTAAGRAARHGPLDKAVKAGTPPWPGGPQAQPYRQ